LATLKMTSEQVSSFKQVLEKMGIRYEIEETQDLFLILTICGREI